MRPPLEKAAAVRYNQKRFSEKGGLRMKYSRDEVRQYVAEDDVKFIRLAFCDIFGKQKNISIMPAELERAFEYGIAFDASAIAGFGGAVHSDLFLHPDPATISVLPWRPENGKVVRMYCSITHPDGSPFGADTRTLLKKAVTDAEKSGVSFAFGSEMEFYLFQADENGAPTKIPHDQAGYMDIAPEDRGENVRREICLTLEQMGIKPESSHHEEGPGQNEIDFRYSDPVTAADDAVTFRAVVNTIAARNGLWADFSPKPLEGKPGNGMHINLSAHGNGFEDALPRVMAGILAHAADMTAFLNRTEDSYRRFGVSKAPRYISWSSENRSQLIRIPAAQGEYRRAELRSPDPLCNPYLAFTLLMAAGMEGIRQKIALPESADLNLFTAPAEIRAAYRTLPENLSEAKAAARVSDFIRRVLPEEILRQYTR